MKAADCHAHFTLLTDGGVRIVWDCGVRLVNKEEMRVDLEALMEHYPQHHHHRLHHKHSEKVPVTGKVVYLRLGESSGTVAADTSGNGFDGTYQGTPTFDSEE